jgi:DNA invertase Pin-like site-specific DNA recombinase
MSKMADVKVIPATIDIFGQSKTDDPTKKRLVAAYARVSTDSDEQFTSFSAQVRYYTDYINSRPDWELVKVYTDEGISGLMTKKREGFNELIRDALAGKINHIVTKSVSRFARNTVTTLQTIRRLKAAGVSVFFEKENIDTFDGKGELLVTIMSSLAQEESHSISQNVTWGQRKRMQDGKVSMPYKSFLGYKKGEDGKPEIVPEEAAIVQRIYNLYICGYSFRQICDELTADNIPTPKGRDAWSVTTVKSILTNERYMGDALLQKTFTADYLNKVVKKNKGEVEQFYVTDSHPAIVSKEVFEVVQAEIAKNNKIGNGFSNASPFSSKVFCPLCGKQYTRRTFTTTDCRKKTYRLVWQCTEKYRVRGQLCPSDSIWEDDLKFVFVMAFNQVLAEKDHYIDLMLPIADLLCDTTVLDKDERELTERAEGIYSQMTALVKDTSKMTKDHDAYIAEYSELDKRYKEVKERLAGISEEKLARRVKRDNILRFIKSLEKEKTILTEFDEHRFRIMVESITVHSKKDVAVLFKNGIKVHVDISKRRH